MIRRTLLTLALLAAPAIVVAQQPSPMQGQTPATDTSSKGKAAATAHSTKGKKGKKGGKKPAAKPSAKPAAAAKDTSKM